MTGPEKKCRTVAAWSLTASLIAGCVSFLGAAPSDAAPKQPDAHAHGQRRGTDDAVPAFFRERSFTAATLAEVVNHFVEIGEEAAIKELEILATPKNEAHHRDFSMRQRIGWVCRVLF